MIMGDNRVAVYDNGFYNIGVRPTLEDLGVGATGGPHNLPLSNSRFFQMRVRDIASQLLLADPTLTLAAATRPAGLNEELPRILARPAEAAILLHRAAEALGNPPSIVDLLAQPDAKLAAQPPDVTGAVNLLVQARDQLIASSVGNPVEAQVASLTGGATSLL